MAFTTTAVAEHPVRSRGHGIPIPIIILIALFVH
jgi:hypothetical protein